MPLPANVGTGIVTGKFTEDDGTAAGGRVVFTPDVDRLLDASQNTIVVLYEHVAVLDATGSFSQTLVGTDDTDLNPINYTWQVREEINGRAKRVYYIDVPIGTTRDLADISPVPSSAGNAVVVGPPVADGDKGDITVSGSGTIWTVDSVPSFNTLFIGSNEMRILSGAPTEGTLASGIVHCWALPDAVTTIVGAYRRLPSWWATYTLQIAWAPSSAGAGDVRFELRRATVANGAVPTSSGATTVVSTAPGVTDQVVLTPATGAVAVPAGSFYGTRVARTGSNVADTYAGDAKLLGILLTRAS